MSEYIRYTKQPLRHLKSQLGNLDIELTERCNNNCIHCCVNLPADDYEAQTREMTTSQVKEILIEAVALGCLRVRFTGGEPLMRSDFEELYLFARRLGLKVLIFTNARLITPQLANLFARIPPQVKIEISVYGMHPRSYDAVSRTPGSYAEFRQGVDLLLEHSVPFIVKAALLPPNRFELDEFEAWARTIPGMNENQRYAMFFDLRSRRDNLQKNKNIVTLRVTPEDGLAVLTRNNEEEFCKIAREFSNKFMGPVGDQLFHCGAGRGLSIDPYGFAHPCLGLRSPQLSVNVINQKSDVALFNALSHFTALGELRAENPEYLIRCAQCFLKGFCGQCPARSWTEHGNFDTPVEYQCELAHTQARYLGWLGKSEKAWTVKDWRERVQ